MTTTATTAGPRPARSWLARAGTALATVAAALPMTVGTLAATAPPAAAVDRLVVQVSGAFADSSDPSARPARTGVVVGTVATDPLGFVPTTSSNVVERAAFRFTVVCATATGGGCVDGTVLHWDFGDGTSTTSTLGQDNPGDVDTRNALTNFHAYTDPGAFTVRVTVDDTTTPAYGSGAIRALVGPRFADVDAAYQATDAGGTVLTSKSVNPVSEAVWAVSALGLMTGCKPYYTPTTAPPVSGERPEDTGRALFCPRPGRDLVAASGGNQTFDPANPAPRSGYTTDGWNGTAGYTDSRNCLALAANCGLPVDAFLSHGTPKGSPLASCTSGCLKALTNRRILTDTVNPRIWYDPTRCGDNTAAIYNPAATRSITLTRGVEAGCMTRGDFLRALLKAVDGTGVDTLGAPLADTTAAVALDTTSCPAGTPAPAADGRDGIRRATALLSTGAVTISPCHPDAALTNGEAYRMLAAVLRPGTGTGVTLADLDDRSLGYGTLEPYPFRSQVYGVLAAGAPLVGSALCPTTPRTGTADVCFNPYQALTRANAAQLLAFFVLGDTSDVAAVQVELTTDAYQVNIGDTVQLRLSVAAPPWLRPYPTTWQFAVGGTVSDKAARFACAMTGSRTLSEPRMTVTCPVAVNAEPGGGVLPLQVTVNGKTYPPVTLQVNNTAPTVNTVTVPALSEDGAAGTGTVTFADPEGNTVNTVQFASSSNGPWSDQAETPKVKIRAGTVDNSASQTDVLLTPQPDANGSYTVYVRLCDVGNACSLPATVTGTVTPVNDAPIAYPISNVLRDDNVAPIDGDCVAAQSDPTAPNTVRLRGDDPVDDGQSGYESVISAYHVTAPTAPAGVLYVCGAADTWTPVPADTTATTTHPVVLFNPTVGQYGSGSYTYTVVDGGHPAGGLSSTPQPISVTNSRPGVAPTALLDVDQAAGVELTSDFTFSAARSNDDGNPAGVVSYAFDYGDGTGTSEQSMPTLTHRYTTAGMYTVRLTVTDSEGLTSTTTLQVSVAKNLLGNPTVNTDPAGWDPADAGVTVTGTAQAPHGGAKAAAVTRTGAGPGCRVSAAVPGLTNGTVAASPYRALVWVRATAESAGAPVSVTVTETNAGANAGSLTTNDTLGAAGTWRQIPLTYTAAQSDSSLRLTFGLPNFTGMACFDFDDVAISSP